MATNTEKIVVQVVVKGEKSLQRLNKSTNKTTKSLGKMATGIAAVAAAFVAVSKQIGGAISTFKKFEFQMAKVKATTGATEKDFKKLTATAKQLGRTTFFTASQVGELQMNYAKLGFTTSEILDAQEATLRLATATGSDLARAAIVAGAAVRGFGLDASETERVVDVMAVAFTSSALDIEKWQTSMTKVAPIAAGANVSIESTAAIMGKLTDAGIEASIAGTSMRNIFLKMQDSTSDLSEHLGFTVKSSDDLERALIQLNSEGLSNEEIMGLVDLRQVAAFATMVNGTDTIIEMTDALEDANGAAQEMADIMADTLEGDIITAKSAWEGFQLSIMTGSSDISKWLREAVQTWTFVLNEWSDSLKSTDDIAAEMFTNTSKSANDAVKEGERFSKVVGDTAWITNLSRELEEEMHLLKRGLAGKEWEIGNSEFKIKKLTEKAEKEGKTLKRTSTAQEIAQEQSKLAEKIKIFEATKQTIQDLAEEVKVQKEKETDAVVTANAEQFQSDQQTIRDAEKLTKKQKRDAEKLADEKKKLAKEALSLEKDEFRESQEALRKALQEELNADKQNLIDGTITQKEYDLRAFEAEQAHLENMKNLNIVYAEDVVDINGQILDNDLNRIKKVADAELDAFRQKQNLKQKTLDLAVEAADAIMTVTTQNIDRRLSGETKLLEERKEAGVISQEQYEEGVEKVERAAFERKKKIALLEVAIDTASAVAKIKLNAAVMASNPITIGFMGMSISQIGLAIATGAIQAAVIASQKFAQGGMIEEFANGGLVHGKSHAQGGERFAVGGRVVELEGGEAVINKRSTAMFSKQLSAMNSAGGGVKFADGGLLNMPSFSQQQFNAIGQNQMMGAMGSSSKVVVVEADITDSQNSVSVIQSEATI